MSKRNNRRMTFIGVGFMFAVLSMMYSTAIFAVQDFLMPQLTIPIPRGASMMIGALLLSMGIPLYLISGITIRKYFKRGELATSGVYAYIRHPVYASWIVFIIPGVVLLMDSLLGLSIPLFMYAVFRILIVREDTYLEERFGEEFREFRSHVGEIFPKPKAFFRTRLIRRE